MDMISMSSVIPHVFSGRTDLCSEVWGQDVLMEKGKVYLLEAHSGQGKSTFCSYVLGYRNDYAGSLCFDDKDVSSFSVTDWVKIRRCYVSHLFQELRLFPELTAWENVQIKNVLTGYQSDERLRQWFDELEIADKLDTPVGKMSYGQRQRVAMMRALCQPFDFILVDEPVSHLDDEHARVMCGLMMREVKAQGAGVIVTSIGKHFELNYDKILRL